jgi:hypothetical protein
MSLSMKVFMIDRTYPFEYFLSISHVYWKDHRIMTISFSITFQ